MKADHPRPNYRANLVTMTVNVFENMNEPLINLSPFSLKDKDTY